MTIELLIADYRNRAHGDDLVYLLDLYSRHEMGQSEPLADAVKATIVETLAGHCGAFSVLCYVDGRPAGLANCFTVLSTFAGKPLINIHDVYVHDDFRGQGLSYRLLEKVEAEARARGCARLTLEVLDPEPSRPP